MQLTIKQQKGLDIALERYKEHKKCTVISGYAGSRKIYFSKIYNKSFTGR